MSQWSRNKLAAAEMWLYRGMLRIPWQAKKTNIEVLKLAKVKTRLLDIILQHQLRFLGHVLRHGRTEHLVLTGKLNGTYGRGRQRQTYKYAELETPWSRLQADAADQRS